MSWAAVAVGAVSLGTAVVKGAQAKKQRKAAEKIAAQNQQRETSPELKNLYTEGKSLYQGRMPGAGQAEQNLLAANANFNANVDRNATSGSQAISAKTAALGQTGQNFNDLARQEAMNKQNRFGVYSDVTRYMDASRDQNYQDKLRTYYDELNYKRGLEGAAIQNQAGMWGDIGNAVGAYATYRAGGGAGFGGGGSGSAGVDTSGYTAATYDYPQQDLTRGQMPTPSGQPRRFP